MKRHFREYCCAEIDSGFLDKPVELKITFYQDQKLVLHLHRFELEDIAQRIQEQFKKDMDIAQRRLSVFKSSNHNG